MAPLLLLFLLGGLCALFSLASSSPATKKCGDAKKRREEEGEELEESLKRLGIAVSSAAEAAALVARVDANSDGLIDIHEFRELYDSIPKRRKSHQQHPLPSTAAADEEAAAADEEYEAEEEERDLREAFDVFDGNKDGLISAEELGTVLGSLGLRQHGGRPAVAECRDMIRLVDSDGDGMVSFEEFKRMMTVVKA
uniref:EF-hand domain-containing protein n=1 Tax=Oryza barthii TaxID=65489 RepID=A0A0D3GDD0_9ORYZ